MVEVVRYLLIAALLIGIAVILAGCGGVQAPPSTLANPPSWCLSSPQRLPQLLPGENLVEKHAQLRRQYSAEASKTRCLQRYVKTVKG
jgi:hypothetical protein